MKPDSIPPRSCSTFASGATQFVVHDAFETMWCDSGSYSSSLTPSTTVKSGSVAGAEMTTFFAPASRCFCAPARSVKKPVDSSTTSTPRSPHGSAAGSRSESMRTSSPAARSDPSASSTSPWNGPSFESYLQEVGHRLRVAEVVQRDDLEVGPERVLRAEEVPPDAAESVDARRECPSSPPFRRYPGRVCRLSSRTTVVAASSSSRAGADGLPPSSRRVGRAPRARAATQSG